MIAIQAVARPLFVFLLGLMIFDGATAHTPRPPQEQIAKWVEEAERLKAAGLSNQAISLYRLVLRCDPQNSTLLNQAGRLFYDVGDLKAAAEHWTRAAEFDPSNAKYHNNAGFAHGKLENYTLGMKHLEMAVELEPRTLRYANNLATIYVDAGYDGKAIATLLQSHQNPADANFNMAYLYSKRNRNDEAMRHLKAALSHNPKHFRALDLRDAIRPENRFASQNNSRTQ